MAEEKERPELSKELEGLWEADLEPEFPLDETDDSGEFSSAGEADLPSEAEEELDEWEEYVDSHWLIYDENEWK